MNNKFTLDTRDYRIEDDGTVVYRILALEGFHSQMGYIPAGEYGGYVESEENLSKYRTCWIDKNSVVKGDALVASEAMVMDSTIDGNATIGDKSWVASSYISDYAVVSGRAAVLGSMVTKNAVVSGATKLYKSQVCGDACVFDKVCLERAVIEDCVGSFVMREKDSRALCTHKYTLIPLGDSLGGLFRLRANIEITNFSASTNECRIIPAGSLGGIVSGVHNLSRFGSSWIDYGSMVIGNASVHDYAFITGNSILHDNAVVCGGAYIDNCVLNGHTYVAGKALLRDVKLGGKARIFGAARCDSCGIYINVDNSNNVEKSDFEDNSREDGQAQECLFAQQF